MESVVIYVKGGMVTDVYATKANIDVTVVDLDTEQGEELEAELKANNEIPEHQVY